MKKVVVALAAFGLFQTAQAQFADSFTNLVSTQEYGTSLEFDMNNDISGMQAYRFITQTNKTLQFQARNLFGWTTAMTYTGNKVGVGTTSPRSIFDVGGTAYANKLILDSSGSGAQLQIGPAVSQNDRVMNFLVSGTYSGFDFMDTNGNIRLDYDINTTYSNFGMKDHNGIEIFKFANEPGFDSYLHLPLPQSRIVVGASGGYRFSEGHKLVIKNGDALVEGDVVAEGNLTTEGNLIAEGNVGIGTLNPDAKLAVKGDIHCEEVRVDLNVPADYVFEKYYLGSSSLKEDYTMPTLEEVAKFTEENHHLPNIPSATEIQEKGLDVGEMTNLLLQKIEELTLYTIEQEKRIKELEASLSKK
ncbi:MAG: polymer-forming cytoskeletal protein [Bacteroidota bacterium]